jgi:hypothetical protein
VDHFLALAVPLQKVGSDFGMSTLEFVVGRLANVVQ